MKRNRIAAGALALALGFGAVAPSFAAEAPKSETASYLFQTQYKSLLERTNTERNNYLAALSAYNTADANLKTARENVRKKAEEYEALRKDLSEDLNILKVEEQNAWDYLENVIDALVPGTKGRGKIINRTSKTVEIYTVVTTGFGALQVVPYTYTYSTADLVGISEESIINYVKQYADYNKDGSGRKYTEEEVRVAYRRWANANADVRRWSADVQKLTAKLQELRAAETARDVAQTQYDAAKAALAKHYVNGVDGQLIWERSLGEVQAASYGYNVVIQAVDGKILVLEKEAAKKVSVAELQKAVDKANETLRAVELLKQYAGNTAKKNMGKLDELVKKQKALIAEAEALIAAEKKATASLFSTAYASEGTRSAEDILKDLENTDEEIKEEMSNVDKAEEVKSEDDNKDDKKEEADDDKKEDNKEDKKEETKVIEKTTTVVTPAASNKTAGSNAKTGIAGVAGVAGVLAAATAAYAASKKN